MIKPREGEMNYKELEELAGYYMFVAACLSEEDRKILKDEWNKQGGFTNIEWWKFVMENTSVGLDIKIN